MSKETVVVRGLPHDIHRAGLEACISQSAAAGPHLSSFSLVRLRRGKAACKARGRPAVPAWAVFRCSVALLAPTLAGVFDGCSVPSPSGEPWPNVCTVEYAPLQAPSAPVVKSTEAAIFRDDDFMAWVARKASGVGEEVAAAAPAAPVVNPAVQRVLRAWFHGGALRKDGGGKSSSKGSAKGGKDEERAAGEDGSSKKRRSRRRGGKRSGEKAADTEEVGADGGKERGGRSRDRDRGSRDKKSKRERKDRKLTVEEELLRENEKEEEKIIRRAERAARKEEKRKLEELIERKRQQRAERRGAKEAMLASANAGLASGPMSVRVGASSSSTGGGGGSKFTVSDTRKGTAISAKAAAKILEACPYLPGTEPPPSKAAPPRAPAPCYVDPDEPTVSTRPKPPSGDQRPKLLRRPKE